MDKHRFDQEVRPFVTEIPTEIQGKAFDRLDLDKWVDYYKQRSGRPSQDLLGHRSGRITTHYSAAEIGSLINAANKVCETEQNQLSSPTLTLLRCANAGSIPVHVNSGQAYASANLSW